MFLGEDEQFDFNGKLIKIFNYVFAISVLISAIQIMDYFFSLIKHGFNLLTVLKIFGSFLFIALSIFARSKIISVLGEETDWNLQQRKPSKISRFPLFVNLVIAAKKLIQIHRFYNPEQLIIPFEKFYDHCLALDRFEWIPHIQRILRKLKRGIVPAAICEYQIATRPPNYNLKIGKTYIVVGRLNNNA